MLVIETDDTHLAERDYVLSVLLGDFLGVSWTRQSADRQDVGITVADQQGELLLPDTLLRASEQSWLTSASVPSRPIPRWDVGELGEPVTVVDEKVPVIYGDAQPEFRKTEHCLRLPIDIFGSAFFMLSRYEEMVVNQRDEHDRFPAWASLAYQEGFLERPIVDEYVEILWSTLKSLWPGLTRKERTPRTVVSCDVDNPYAAYTKSLAGTVRKMGGDLLKRRGPVDAVRTLRNTLGTRRGDYRHDPFDTFDWMMDVNESAGNKVAFYFLVKNTVPGFDAHYSINEPRIRALMRRIHKRGHEIGLHGSYGTLRDAAQMKREVSRLREIMDEEGIQQDVIGARQHYLRWSSMDTARSMDASGLVYDTSLAYADRCGFRCGTAQCFPIYDLRAEREIALVERPLVVMECSVLADKYMGVTDPLSALDIISDLREKTFRYGGSFGLLWHNSYLGARRLREIYSEIIGNSV